MAATEVAQTSGVALVAWWGAATGTAGLLWQFVSWYRSGARVSVDWHFMRFTNPETQETRPYALSVWVVNRGRTAVQLKGFGFASPHRIAHWLPGRLRSRVRWPAEVWGAWQRKLPGEDGRPVELPRILEGQTTVEFQLRYMDLHGFLWDSEGRERRVMRPYAVLGNGRRVFGKPADVSLLV